MKITIPLAFCALLAGAADTLAHRTTVFLGADGAPRVKYEMAAGDDTMRFPDREGRTHTVVRAPWWKLDPQCFALDPMSLRRLKDDCPAPEIVLDWDENVRDRMYPAVVKLRNGGVLVFASYIQTLTRDGSAVDEIVLEAPSGGVAAFRGEKSARSLTLDSRTFAQDGRGWIYLGPDRFAEEGAARVLVDDGVPPAFRAEMVELAPQLIRIFSERLGAQLPEQPTFYLTWAARGAPSRDLQADVVPGSVIRFTLVGERWNSGAPDLVARFRNTLAHELAHLWNAGIFRPASWAAPWISEGGAEFLGIAALVDAGKLDGPAAAQRIVTSFNDCALIVRGRAWVSVYGREMGRIPYACGLAIQFGIVAAARRRDPTIDPFKFWKGIGSAPTYHEAALVQYLERVGVDESAVLARIFTDKDTPFVDALRAIYAGGGLEVRSAVEFPASLHPLVVNNLLAAIMGDDCNGAHSFNRQDEYFLTQEIKGCATFRGPMKVRYIAGEDMLRSPFEAIAAARRACESAQSVTLRSVDGIELAPKCSERSLRDLPGREVAIELDTSSVEAVLKANAPAASTPAAAPSTRIRCL